MPQLIQPKDAPNVAVFAISLLIVIAAGFFYIYPQYNALQANQGELTKTESELNIWQSKQNAVNTAIQKMNNNTDLNLIGIALPDSAIIPHFYAQIEQLARNSNLQLASISAQDPQGKSSDPASAALAAQASSAGQGSVVVVPASMEVKGSISNLNNFLKSLERSMRFIDVQDMDVSSTQDSNGGSALSIRMNLRVYYQK